MQITTQDEEVILKQVKDFAEQSHGTQRRKYSEEPYIHHLHRVMNTCYLYLNNLPVLSAALLHDVLEDTAVTKSQLNEFLNSVMSPEDAEHTINLVEELTDVYTTNNYPNDTREVRKQQEFERLANIQAEAQTIKYADVLDNAANIAEYDVDFGPLFLGEYLDLLGAMDKGNQVLYRETVKSVVDHLDKLSL